MAMAIANLITESELSPEYVVSTQFDPRGVIGVVTPCTNPIVTPMCNAMFALKGRNSIIKLEEMPFRNVLVADERLALQGFRKI